MYVSNRPFKIIDIQEVTLSATATKVDVKVGQPFMVEQRGANDAFMGTTATLCDLGVRIKTGEKVGNFVSANGAMYFKGTATQKLYIYYFE